MPDAPLGAVIEDELLRAALPSEPDGCAPFPKGLADAAFLRAGLISAQLAKAGKFRNALRFLPRAGARCGRLGRGLGAF